MSRGIEDQIPGAFDHEQLRYNRFGRQAVQRSVTFMPGEITANPKSEVGDPNRRLDDRL